MIKDCEFLRIERYHYQGIRYIVTHDILARVQLVCFLDDYAMIVREIINTIAGWKPGRQYACIEVAQPKC